jgi:hypothetical protein
MKDKTWWGKFQFEINQSQYWQLGQCLLHIERTQNEWKIAHQYLAESTDPSVKIAVENFPKVKSELFSLNRFGFEHSPSQISLTPVLGDRAQVSRPEFSFYIPGYEHITLYISSPAWIRLEIGDPLLLLQEIPVVRLSDTWFGEDTLEGEICYASHTRYRMQLDPNSFRSYRIITEVTIKNHTNEHLLIERIRLPLPSLSIYADENGNLWTERLMIKNGSAVGGMLTTIGKSVPKIAGSTKLISGPRMVVKPKKGILHILKAKITY